MDERAIKKLAIILIVAIAIILLFKFMLTRSYSNLNKINAAKKPHAVVIEISKTPGDVPANAVLTPPLVEPAPAEAASAVVSTPADSAQSQ